MSDFRIVNKSSKFALSVNHRIILEVKTMETMEYSGILLSYFSDESTTCIPAAKEHYLTFVYSGELEFELNGEHTFVYGGECVFLRRNHKLKFHKRGFDGHPYKGISIELSRNSLREYFHELHQASLPHAVSPHEIDVQKLEVGPDILALFGRIEPYYRQPAPDTTFSKEIIHDVIELLLSRSQRFYPTLFDFSDPWKIDIMDFMEKHFADDLSIRDFARYTGRSLATFKRDFAKISSLTPQRWVIERRLKEAYDLIFNHNRKANQVYIEVGFKDISHFYRKFKEQYGTLPSV